MSNFTCVAVARQWYGKEKGIDIAKEGITVPIHVLTATPHSSTIKSLSLLGIGSSNIIKIKLKRVTEKQFVLKIWKIISRH